MIDTNTKDSNNTPVAFFDFDGTLTTGDTLMPFLKFVVGIPKYYWYLILVTPILIAYALKLIRNDIAKEKVLKRYLVGYSIDVLRRKGEKFSQEVIPLMLRDEGITKLKWHQSQGHSCVLVSASLDVWLQPWAKENGFDEILSTSLQVIDTRVTGFISGKNCYGQEKVSRIQNWLQNNNRSPKHTYAYGDTKGDIYMLTSVYSGYLLTSNKFKLVDIDSSNI